MVAESDDPLFFDHPDDGRKQTPADKRLATWHRVGEGQLFLTNRRLIWTCPEGQRDFRLLDVASVYSAFHRGLSLLYDTRLYCVQFQEESVLKWLTYFGHLAEQVEAATGHRIIVSDY